MRDFFAVTYLCFINFLAMTFYGVGAAFNASAAMFQVLYNRSVARQDERFLKSDQAAGHKPVAAPAPINRAVN